MSRSLAIALIINNVVLSWAVLQLNGTLRTVMSMVDNNFIRIVGLLSKSYENGYNIDLIVAFLSRAN